VERNASEGRFYLHERELPVSIGAIPLALDDLIHGASVQVPRV